MYFLTIHCLYTHSSSDGLHYYSLFIPFIMASRQKETSMGGASGSDIWIKNPDLLNKMIRIANLVVVRQSPLKDAKILFESKERKDIDDLSKALVMTKPHLASHCMCSGTPAIYLYDKHDKLLLDITNHHGHSIRCSLCSSTDVPLANIESWLQWFDD
jgi:hypothetical protein